MNQFPTSVKNKPLFPTFTQIGNSSKQQSSNETNAKLKLGLGFDKFKTDKRMTESFLGRTGERMMNQNQ